MTWDDVCVVARELPSVEMGSYHGYPALRVAGKFLARLSDDALSVEFKAFDVDERDAMLLARPDVFHVPEGFNGAGVFARLAALDETTLSDVLENRWRHMAPKKLINAYDAGG